MNLQPGQVIKLDHPLDQPLSGVINRSLSLAGSVVNSGEKRAFQVATLP
jgi:flagellar motor switch protein FliM